MVKGLEKERFYKSEDFEGDDFESDEDFLKDVFEEIDED